MQEIRTIRAGLIATGLMTAMTYAAPAVGVPSLDECSVIGSRLTGVDCPSGSRGWWLGMAAHWLNGALVFPSVYARIVRNRLPGPAVAKGLQWGAALWLFSQLGLMPWAGRGLFESREPRRWPEVLESLAEHLVYGAVLGTILAPRTNDRGRAMHHNGGWRMECRKSAALHLPFSIFHRHPSPVILTEHPKCRESE